jgi:hypothetical protein
MSIGFVVVDQLFEIDQPADGACDEPAISTTRPSGNQDNHKARGGYPKLRVDVNLDLQYPATTLSTKGSRFSPFPGITVDQFPVRKIGFKEGVGNESCGALSWPFGFWFPTPFFNDQSEARSGSRSRRRLLPGQSIRQGESWSSQFC